MNKRMFGLISILLLLVFAGALLAACASSSPAPTKSTSTLSSGGGTADGQTLMNTRCTVCHSTARILSAHQTAAQWKATVDKMISNGAKLNPQEEQTLVTYLSQNYK
ncbi:MAG: hypothetical protein WCE68_15205 [Anaerolineales bacterium]